MILLDSPSDRTCQVRSGRTADPLTIRPDDFVNLVKSARTLLGALVHVQNSKMDSKATLVWSERMEQTAFSSWFVQASLFFLWDKTAKTFQISDEQTEE